ncbi:hypothetical protein EYF80_006862 [Liparis tanakae]|uniref:Uncharacterized protein n=1 Tax=Liparis tanakae TaxID=230148 RepID=A0A4Z2IY49_9TELE|nr:hypothetical protein EYF80_006862 [Liparis tanakae]
MKLRSRARRPVVRTLVSVAAAMEARIPSDTELADSASSPTQRPGTDSSSAGGVCCARPGGFLPAESKRVKHLACWRFASTPQQTSGDDGMQRHASSRVSPERVQSENTTAGADILLAELELEPRRHHSLLSGVRGGRTRNNAHGTFRVTSREDGSLRARAATSSCPAVCIRHRFPLQAGCQQPAAAAPRCSTDHNHDQIVLFTFSQSFGRGIQELLGEITGRESVKDPGVVFIPAPPHRQADDPGGLFLVEVGHQVAKRPLSRGRGVGRRRILRRPGNRQQDGVAAGTRHLDAPGHLVQLGLVQPESLGDLQLAHRAPRRALGEQVAGHAVVALQQVHVGREVAVLEQQHAVPGQTEFCAVRFGRLAPLGVVLGTFSFGRPFAAAVAGFALTLHDRRNAAAARRPLVGETLDLEPPFSRTSFQAAVAFSCRRGPLGPQRALRVTEAPSVSAATSRTAVRRSTPAPYCPLGAVGGVVYMASVLH